MENNQLMKQLFTYTLELWYRHGSDEKEFMETTVVAKNDEIAKQLAETARKNIFKVEIKSKENYVEPKH